MRKKILGVFLLVGSVMLIGFLMSQKQRPAFKSTAVNKKLKVIVEDVTPQQNKVNLITHGNLEPVWKSQLTTEVTGKVIEISDKLMSGAKFNSGDVLLKIDPTRYLAEYDRSQAQLAEAKELLEEEKVRSEKAEKDWNRVNPNKKAPDYTLRLPQLKSAQKNYESAQSNLKLAKRNLDQTTLKAPYDGAVIQRWTHLGEFLQSSAAVADIFSTGEMELKVSMREDQINTLNNFQINTIHVYDQNQPDQKWTAEISRMDQIINSKDRWRLVYLNINPSAEVGLPIAGQFLTVEIEARSMQETIEIKERSLNVDGHLWKVNTEGLLARMKPNIIFKSGDKVVIEKSPEITYPFQLVSFPTQSLLEGIEVQAEYLYQE